MTSRIIAACATTVLALAGGLAAPSAAQPVPGTLDQLCGTLAWPRPLPDVAGQFLSQTIRLGALGCWTNVRGIAPDGHDPVHSPVGTDRTDFRVSAVSPSPGTPVGRNETVTLQLTPADPAAPAVFHPCDWVSADEAGALLGAPVQTRPLGDQAGSVDISCSYSSGVSDTAMQAGLRLPQSFPVTAAAQFGLATSAKNGTPLDGVGVQAQCVLEPSTTPPSTTVVVLLDGNRLYRATSWYGTSCEKLKQFAQIAIGRIGV
ncbi:PASTA domain-containing protein [Mycobacterium sp. CVI_P3]|uniref:PASTA domain-containing protein n=1 Tax=Mycobacterium pinniadriaticum TaxID=2994102 RepID=A0ABT3SCM9_9MYCO|nr:PASTA domain-containing protein [Mycobacterium pinniadriaticum]MCX2930796.1 PASTA domain-containing protein [Mycobacterium pinniadriaticum]MCX2937220.1 PASTA domain-containing protein [Mycobacterium pinniadriaticum]